MYESVILNESVERQKDVLTLVVKGLCKKCAVTLRVMSTFLQSQGAARDEAYFGDPTDEFRVIKGLSSNACRLLH